MNDTKNASILVVDDTPANLDLLRDILEVEGYGIRALPGGSLALRSAQANPPDLILLDIKMPGMDGYEVCAKLKADPRTKDIPVIFISALHEADDKVRAFSAGGVDYLTKPFQSEEVLARVSTHLHLRALHRRLEARNEELAEAKVKAETANRAKSAFLANMSHELRTPLNAVLGVAQILEREPSLGERNLRNVEMLRRGGELLVELINDVLDLAKIEAGRFESVPQSWQTHGFFEELHAMFRVRAEQKGLRFSYEDESSLPSTLYCDNRRLRQIAMNLLGNAVKFTTQGSVALRARFHAEKLTLEVEDTGPGIPQQMLESIFEPFEQAGDSAQKIQGTGLGLTIARKLAEMMGGEISVNSRLGEGSRFSVTIPAEVVSTLAEAQDLGDHPAVLGYRRTSGTGSLKVLVCDDIEDNRELLRILLEPMGFVVIEADNGRRCVELARSEAPDIILLDIRMPEVDGIEAVRRLHHEPGLKEIPIVAITANAFAEIRDQTAKIGCSAHLTKPLRLAELLDVIQRLLPLEWKYASVEDRGRDDAQAESLPADAIQRLQSLCKRGRITEVAQFADELASSGCCPNLARRVGELAAGFRLAELQALVLSLPQTLDRTQS